MAVIANTFTTSDANLNMEDFSNVVDDITPDETPIYSLLSKTSAETTTPEWAEDELPTPGENAQIEGKEYEPQAVEPGTKYRGYTQIFDKEWSISESQAKSRNAGNTERPSYQMVKKAKELRRDIEYALVDNTPSGTNVPGNGSSPQTGTGATARGRRFGGLSSWYVDENIVDRHAAPAGRGYSQTTLRTRSITHATDANRVVFSKANLDEALRKIKTAGGKPGYVFVSLFNKVKFVEFMSNANVAAFRYAASAGKKNVIIATADVYEGPMGRVMVIPNQVMTEADSTTNHIAHCAHILDSEKIEMKVFRKIQPQSIGKVGDAVAGKLVAEMTVAPTNPKAHGCVLDITSE